MKITKSLLRMLIKEEIGYLQEADADVMAAMKEVPQAAESMAARIKGEIEKMAEPSGLDPAVLAQAVAALLTEK